MLIESQQILKRKRDTERKEPGRTERKLVYVPNHNLSLNLNLRLNLKYHPKPNNRPRQLQQPSLHPPPHTHHTGTMRLHGHRTAQLLRLVKHDQLHPRELQYHPPLPPHPCCLPTHSLAPSVLPQRLNLGCNSLSEDLRLRPMHSSRLHLSSQGLDQSFSRSDLPSATILSHYHIDE